MDVWLAAVRLNFCGAIAVSNELPNSENADAPPSDRYNVGPLFPLGQVVATPGAIEHCEKNNVSPLTLIRRHQHGDWGDLCNDDRIANENALFVGGRLMSVYLVGAEKLYVITEWNRSATTLLRAIEY